MDLKDLRLLGGKLCINFANSYDNVAPGERLDFLTSYTDFARWSRHAELVSAADARALVELAREDEEAAVAVFERALALRAALRSALRQIAGRGAVDAADLATIHREYARAIEAIYLTPAGDRFDWDWQPRSPQLDQPLWPIALSAIELLTRDDTRRIKLCASHDCGWLFYDHSKNRSRRWCSMEGCGSQDKMRRLYRRRKRAAERA